MQAHLPGMLSWLTVSFHRIGDHGVQLGEGIALGGDPAALRIVPSGDKATGFRARAYAKSDFTHRSIVPVLRSEGKRGKRGRRGNGARSRQALPAAVLRNSRRVNRIE